METASSNALHSPSSESLTDACPECYNSQRDIVYWRDLPVNPAIKAYRDSYISPPKDFYPSLVAAAAAWGITIYENEEGEWIHEHLESD